MIPKSKFAAAQVNSTQLLCYRYYCTKKLIHHGFSHVCQPEEQHAFRFRHRLEEDLMPANLCVDGLLIVNVPIGVVGLDYPRRLTVGILVQTILARP